MCWNRREEQEGEKLSCDIEVYELRKIREEEERREEGMQGEKRKGERKGIK